MIFSSLVDLLKVVILSVVKNRDFYFFEIIVPKSDFKAISIINITWKLLSSLVSYKELITQAL